HGPGGVYRLQGTGQPQSKYSQGRFRENTGLEHRLLEGGPGDVLGGHPRNFRVRVGIDHGRGEGPTHALSSTDLPGKTCPELGVVGKFLLDHLHRAQVIAGCARKVDPAHTARAETGQQTVRADAVGVIGGERLHGEAKSSLLRTEAEPVIGPVEGTWTM